jgi:hypothetical protein
MALKWTSFRIYVKDFVTFLMVFSIVIGLLTIIFLNILLIFEIRFKIKYSI